MKSYIQHLRIYDNPYEINNYKYKFSSCKIHKKTQLNALLVNIFSTKFNFGKKPQKRQKPFKKNNGKIHFN